MRNTLIHAGPLISLFDRSDTYHFKALRFIEDFKGYLWTTWPVATEVSHMLDFSAKVQLAFLRWIDRGGLQLFHLEENHIHSIIELSEKFSDVPMDLADASLIVAAEGMGLTKIASIDSDFYIYRDIRNRYLKNVFL